MKSRPYSAQSCCEVLEDFAQRFAKELLTKYSSSINVLNRSSSRPKDFNDSLWGTIGLTPLEVALVDSPLFQRLRFLQQLGTVHWVYPSAVHTRFDHALGSLFQVGQFVRAINEIASQTNKQNNVPISEANKYMLRLGALCAHVGHLAFSDVSHSVIEKLPKFETIQNDFSAREFPAERGDNCSITQIISYYIVKSDSFRSFLFNALDHNQPKIQFGDGLTDKANKDLLIDKLSLVVAGKKIDNNLPFLHEIIYGPFGALKLDNLVRNARFTGIPSVVDVNRLMQKLSIQRRLASTLPPSLAGALAIKEGEAVWLFGVKPTATAVLNEIQLAQVLISTKIERHPKVLAIEQMLAVALRRIGGVVEPAALLQLLSRHSEFTLLGMSSQGAIASLGLPVSARGPRRLREALDIFAALRERRLWVRAFQLNPRVLLRTNADDRGIEKLRDDLAHPQRSEDFLKRTIAATLKVLRASGDNTSTENMLIANVGLRSLTPVASETQVGRARIIPTNGSPYQLSDTWHGRGNWAEQYLQGQPSACIFCRQDVADAVYVAVERAVWEVYRASLPRDSIEGSKRDAIRLNEFKLSLDHAYWSGLPFNIRPRLTTLNEEAVQRDIAGVANKLSIINDFKDQTFEAAPLHERIVMWLNQFGSDSNAACALYLLKHLRVLTRQDTYNALNDFLLKHPEFRGAFVVPLGAAKDGSSLQTYFANDIKSKDISTGSVGDYLSSNNASPLIFIDDFIGSGSQAVDILAAMFGRSDLRNMDLDEFRVALLPDELTKLTSKKIAFVFVAAWDAGIKAIEGATKTLGLDAIVSCHLQESALPFVHDLLLKSHFQPKVVAEFIAKCKDIGRDLVRTERREGVVRTVTKKKVTDRALGYGNRGMLLTSLVNAPTQTLTAIWMLGAVGGAEWTPLIRRRPKS